MYVLRYCYSYMKHESLELTKGYAISHFCVPPGTEPDFLLIRLISALITTGTIANIGDPIIKTTIT